MGASVDKLRIAGKAGDRGITEFHDARCDSCHAPSLLGLDEKWPTRITATAVNS